MNPLRAMVLVALALLASVDLSHASAITKKFDIVAQSAATGLNEFAKQADITLVFSYEIVSGTTINPIKGNYSVGEALGLMLEGTKLSYQQVSDSTVAISRKSDTIASGDSIHDQIRLAQFAEMQKVQDAPQEPRKDTARSTSKQTGRTVGKEASDEIVVTGSHIRGQVNPTVPLEIYDREQIERSGLTTTQDFLRTLPQNFKGGAQGPSEDGILMSGGARNLEVASGANLRGLGSSATLVLLDGHRVAPSNYGSMVDISMVPVGAIDRIEVLTDGASAIYGADAVGGVININLRKDYEGAQTQLTAGRVSDGGRREYTAGQTFGHGWGSGNAVASLQYYDASSLGSDERPFTRHVLQPTDIYPATRKYSALLSGRQQMGPDADVFFGLLANRNRQEQAWTTTSYVQYGNIKTKSASVNLGAGWRPFGDWRIEASGTFGNVDTGLNDWLTPPQAGYTHPDGRLVIQSEFTLREGQLKADGALFALPAGKVRTAFGASYRSEQYRIQTDVLTSGNFAPKRHVSAAFAELYAPVAPHVELTAAVRYDDYSDFGTTTNPQFGISWTPLENLKFRAAYGTSFRAPTPAELVDNRDPLLFGYPGFALPGGGTTTVLLVGATEPLEAETSRNKSVGLEYRPQFAPRASLTLNYYDIDFKNRIIFAPFDPAALTKPDVYGALIRQFSSDAEVAAFVAELAARPGTRNFAGDTTGVRYSVPFLNLNAARVRTSGLDLRMRNAFTVGANTLSAAVNATYIFRIDSGFCDTCALVDLAGTYGQPTNLRLRGDAGWERGAWQVNAALNFADSYTDTSTAIPGSVEQYTTVDCNVRYSPPALRGTTLVLSAINLFDNAPPATGGGAGGFQGVQYDPANANPLGRFVSLQLSKTW